jgi:maltoporin
MQRTRCPRPGLRFTVVAALALLAAGGAQAVDWTGYFRGGPASTNVDGKSRQCYGLDGPGLKYRLGNECDFYGEFLLSQPFKQDDGVQYSANLMTKFYSPNSETDGANVGIEQAYLDIKGLDFAPQATWWMGKRRERNDVHIVDTFFVNTSGVGAGMTALPLGDGGTKFAVSFYKTDSGDHTSPGGHGAARAHVDFYDIPVNPDGKLRVLGTVSKADDGGTAVKGTSGYGLSVEHTQDNFLGWGGGNHVWLQMAQGSTALNQTFGDPIAPSGSKSWRAVESFTFQVGPLGGQTLALFQQDKTAAGKTNSTSLGGRVSYAVTKNLKLLAELGLSSKKPDGQPAEHLNKLTLGPALSNGPGFWKRPELRLYVTHATYNAAAANDAANGLVAGTTSGTSYGAQVEVWF